MKDLDERAIRSALDALGAPQAPIHVLESTTSTNDDARRLAAEGAAHGTFVVSDTQSAGRGRGGHTWHSPEGANIYLSLLLRPNLDALILPRFTLVVGLVVARAVEAFCPARALVKWPNDVLIEGRKVAGVLVEGQLRGGRVSSVVVGVGVNVHDQTFPQELQAIATSLAAEGGANLDRSRVVASLVAGVVKELALFEAQGLAPFLDALRERDALFARRVHMADVSGVALGIDGEGRLRVRDDRGEEHAVVSGEIALACAAPDVDASLGAP